VTPVIDFSLAQAAAVADLIRHAADNHVMPYFRAPDLIDVRQKTGPTDLVTAADLACEAALTPALSALLPGSLVVGEEAAAADPAVLENLCGDAPVWIIDPVDGTMNFANGRPTFAVLVALAVHDVTVAGWIYDPNVMRMSWAVKGLGCYTNGEQTVAQGTSAGALPFSDVCGAISSRFCTPEVGQTLRRRAKGLRRSLCLGSAGQEYLHLIDSRLQASLYHRLMPWDHAAGVLMLEEAGGYAALVDGERPYTPYSGIDAGPLLSAVNRDTWLRLRDYLFAETTEDA
jgi:fructose-1,6-bisphosphatase/inositol monophosphatase family enzyme